MGQHTDRAVTNPEKYMTDTKHTDSVEAWREKMYEWCERNCKPGEFHFGSLIQIVYDEISTLQAQTSQQVEEAVKAERLKVISEIEAEVNTLFVFGRQVGIGGLYTTAAMRGPNEEVASWVKKEDVLVCIDKAKPLSTPNHKD